MISYYYYYYFCSNCFCYCRFWLYPQIVSYWIKGFAFFLFLLSTLCYFCYCHINWPRSVSHICSKLSRWWIEKCRNRLLFLLLFIWALVVYCHFCLFFYIIFILSICLCGLSARTRVFSFSLTFAIVNDQLDTRSMGPL